jgi:hypothetical protein
MSGFGGEMLSEYDGERNAAGEEEGGEMRYADGMSTRASGRPMRMRGADRCGLPTAPSCTRACGRQANR